MTQLAIARRVCVGGGGPAGYIRPLPDEALKSRRPCDLCSPEFCPVGVTVFTSTLWFVGQDFFLFKWGG